MLGVITYDISITFAHIFEMRIIRYYCNADDTHEI
jgi:hypothetical protein